MSWRIDRVLGFALILAFAAACTGVPKDSASGKQCSRGLSVAHDELTAAEAKGFSGSVEWTKAASLLTAAKVQYEFEHYPNCIEKVERARRYIKSAQGN